MVNDHLILGTKVLPNTSSRINYNLGTTIDEVDRINGYYNIASSIAIALPITKIVQVYLPPGIYSFNVGIRVAQAGGYVAGSTVTYELMQFEHFDQAVIGGFPLITTLPYR